MRKVVTEMIGHPTSFEGMVEFLAYCKNKPFEAFLRVLQRRYRIEPTTSEERARLFILFFTKSHKSLLRLYDELNDREMTIGKHLGTGVAVRIVKNVRATIHYGDPVTPMFLLEVSRTHEDGKTVQNYRKGRELDRWSISETLQLGELPLEGLLRGMEQELGIHPRKINRSKMTPTVSSLISYHRSSAYRGLYTYEESTWYRVETSQIQPRWELPFYRDSGTIINREWVPEYL